MIKEMFICSTKPGCPPVIVLESDAEWNTGMSQIEQKPDLPRLFSHALDFYNVLKSQAVAQPNGELVFEGYTVRLAKDTLNIAGPTYANVIRCLTDMGSIVQLQRGSKHAPSKWSILDEPSLEQFAGLPHKSSPTSRTLDKRLNQIEQDLRSLRLSIGDLNVQEAYIGLARKIGDLENGNRLSQGGDQLN